MSRTIRWTSGCVLAAVLTASGCQSDSSHAEKGALFGGLLGAGTGAAIGSRNRPRGRRRGDRRRRGRAVGRRDRGGTGRDRGQESGPNRGPARTPRCRRLRHHRRGGRHDPGPRQRRPDHQSHPCPRHGGAAGNQRPDRPATERRQPAGRPSDAGSAAAAADRRGRAGGARRR